MGFAGLALCNAQKASINWVTKWLFSLGSRSVKLAMDGVGFSSFSSSKSVTSKTVNSGEIIEKHKNKSTRNLYMVVQ